MSEGCSNCGYNLGVWDPGIHVNEEMLVKLRAERGMVIGNTWFQKKNKHKDMCVNKIGGIWALMGYVLIDKCAYGSPMDMIVLRGIA